MTAETEAAKNIQEIIARNARYRMQERKDIQVEAEMLAMCNAHRAQVSTQVENRNRQEAEAAALRAQLAAARAEENRLAKEERERQEASSAAMGRYAVGCVVLLGLTGFTELPVWAAVTLCAGLGVLAAAYIFRIWCPLEEDGV